MTTWVQPGPPSIEPGTCPGGVVVHIYTATVPPVLVLTSNVRPDDACPLADKAVHDRERVDAWTAGAPVCLVGYDGDTGQRLTERPG